MAKKKIKRAPRAVGWREPYRRAAARGSTAAEIARDFGVSRQVVHEALRDATTTDESRRVRQRASYKRTRSAETYQCGACGRVGHNRRTCPRAKKGA